MTDSPRSEAGVLAIIEQGPGGEPTVASLEALGAAHIMADSLGRGLDAVVADRGSSYTELGTRGVCRVYEPAGAGPDLAGAGWAAVRQAQPVAVVMPATAAGQAAAGVIAGRMGSDLLSGSTFISEHNGTLQLGRPCLSGRGYAVFAWDRSNPLVVTIEPGAFRAPVGTTSQDPEVIVLDAPVEDDPVGITVLSEVAPSVEELEVVDADVVVAGGAGVGDKEGFTLLAELAGKLGGTVAASRVAVDRGWLPSSRQVGLTGKTISPRVYLAFGISGAPQHIAGIRSAGKVVAINTDAKAAILKVADLALIADLHEVVPALLDRLTASGTRENGGSAR